MPTPDPPPGRSFDRRWVVRIVGLAVAVIVLSAVLAVLLSPSEPADADAFRRRFESSCTRSGVAGDDCRCAWDRWHELVPDAELRAVDQRLRDGGALPAELGDAVARCATGS